MDRRITVTAKAIIALELFFSAFLFYKGYIYSKGRDDLKFQFYILVSSILSFNFSLLVVNGFFSGESCCLLILSGFIYSLLKDENQKEMLL